MPYSIGRVDSWVLQGMAVECRRCDWQGWTWLVGALAFLSLVNVKGK